MDSLTLNVIIPFKIKIIETPHTVFLADVQQEVLKFNYICASWSSAKSDLEMDFLSLENRSFENASFFTSNF